MCLNLLTWLSPAIHPSLQVQAELWSTNHIHPWHYRPCLWGNHYGPALPKGLLDSQGFLENFEHSWFQPLALQGNLFCLLEWLVLCGWLRLGSQATPRILSQVGQVLGLDPTLFQSCPSWTHLGPGHHTDTKPGHHASAAVQSCLVESKLPLEGEGPPRAPTKAGELHLAGKLVRPPWTRPPAQALASRQPPRPTPGSAAPRLGHEPPRRPTRRRRT